ncbi:PKD domain-containing protein [Flaviaesturariibacter amylovorans]|uniref:PKD domain-containing protein n=1 Tax=Flaviaesturariibacter amylovorans TaxID=1084520 RepID=A0ABP8HBI4_9BACT
MKPKNLILSALCTLLTFSLFAQSREPLSFTENKGQWDARVRYRAEVPGGALFLHQDGFTVLQHNDQDLLQLKEEIHNRTGNAKLRLRSHAYRVTFEGAFAKASIEGDKVQAAYSNYFIGNDPSKWAGNCREFLAVNIRNLYPGIDIRYYSENGTLKYDLLVHPGARVSDIALRYTGVDGISVNKEQQLEIRTSVGTVKELAPYSFQYNEKGRQTVNVSYQVKDNVLRFRAKDYDPNTLLVIDPTMIFSSFTGSKAENWGFTATYGPDGAFFGGGIVRSDGFPFSTGAFEDNHQGGEWDIGIMKLNSSGTNREYATYIGGSSIEQAHSLFCDPAGNLVIAGRTNSANYPTRGTQALPDGATNTGYDIVVTKLNASGSNLIGSMRIGGSGEDGVNISSGRARNSLQHNYGDDGRSEVILDAAGNIYVASNTRSTDFFVRNAFQSVSGGLQDAVLLKLSPDVSTVLFSSYLGGDGNDAAYVLALDPVSGRLYAAGGTESSNFPTIGAGIPGLTRGGIDGFVVALPSSGGAPVYSKYVGTPQYDQIFGIQFDRGGFPYIMGQTLGTWPNVNATYYVNGRQFIAKLQPDLSSFVYSTAFGTTSATQPNISPVAFLVDRCENVYVSGWGGTMSLGASNTFPSAGTGGLPTTPDALVMNPPYSSPSQTDGKDFYFFVLKRNATQQLYGAFFGENAPGPGTIPDHVDGGTSRFDANGVIYQAMCANCNSNPKPYFPTTAGAWSRINPAQCNLAMVKIAMNLAGLSSGVQSAIDGVVRDSAGCVPLTVQFRDTVANAQTYEWDFNGDGITDQTTTSANAQFTFNSLGTFRVRLIGVDSNSCNIRDTSYVSIRVGSLEARPSFSFEKLNPCDSLRFRFTNTSVAPPSRPFANNSFVWDFGDGTPPVTAGAGSVTHDFPAPGSYNVKLTIVDTNYCNAPETLDSVLNVAVLVDASFVTPRTGCAPYPAYFENTSAGGQTFSWDFGDGVGTSTEKSPTYTYLNPGKYTVRLRVVDSGTCNIVDSTSFEIEVFNKPRAAIGNVTPQPPEVNTPITFQNNSQDAVRYKWFFGDGDSLITTNQLPVTHDYNETRSYEVILVAYNTNGCPDTARRTVQTLVEAAVDVPNAFTPQSGDINSVVMARGYGIGRMRFTIWNRWGQKVFETENRKTGWDGTYKGKLQPMDVYAYTLEVEFIDGKKATKKGDITLIR